MFGSLGSWGGYGGFGRGYMGAGIGYPYYGGYAYGYPYGCGYQYGYPYGCGRGGWGGYYNVPLLASI